MWADIPLLFPVICSVLFCSSFPLCILKSLGLIRAACVCDWGLWHDSKKENWDHKDGIELIINGQSPRMSPKALKMCKILLITHLEPANYLGAPEGRWGNSENQQNDSLKWADLFLYTSTHTHAAQCIVASEVLLLWSSEEILYHDNTAATQREHEKHQRTDTFLFHTDILRSVAAHFLSK